MCRPELHRVLYRSRAELMASEQWYEAGEVKPRDVDPNPRCYECKSDDHMGRAPMFHPAHRWDRAR